MNFPSNIFLSLLDTVTKKSGGLGTLSVLLCAHNAEKFIQKAIDSILTQTYSDFEFVIVLDAPTDRTAEIVEAYSDPRLKLVYNSVNCGLTRSLNIGLSHCSGDWIARQDADDISLPYRLEKQMAYLSKNPECALLGSSTFLIGENEKNLGVHSVPTVKEDIQWQMLFDNAFVHTSVVFKASVVRELGGYNEFFKRTQDFDLWVRLVAKYQASNLLEPLVKYRHHPESISSKQSENSNYYGDKIIEEHAKILGLPSGWGKALATIRHAQYKKEDLPELWKALEILPQLTSPFIRERFSQYLEFIAVKSAGLSNRLSLCAYREMARTSKKALFTFPYFRWILRIVFGVETFEKLKILRTRLRAS